MAHDESRHPGDEHAGSDEPRHDSAGPITISTTDPAIDSVVEHQADWKAHPDTTLRVETTQVGEPGPLSGPGAARSSMSRATTGGDPRREAAIRAAGRSEVGRGIGTVTIDRIRIPTIGGFGRNHSHSRR